MNDLVLRISLFVITILFLIVESRHVNVVEALVERAFNLEKQISASRNTLVVNWYDGPRVSEACQEGVKRWWPRNGMTFVLNQPFYFVVIVVILFTTLSLPPKQTTVPAPVSQGKPYGT